jgi:hypothetical protein
MRKEGGRKMKAVLFTIALKVPKLFALYYFLYPWVIVQEAEDFTIKRDGDNFVIVTAPSLVELLAAVRIQKWVGPIARFPWLYKVLAIKLANHYRTHKKLA